MNMALLTELISEAINPPPLVRSVYPQIPEVELPSKWLEFEEKLGEFKQEYKKTLLKLRESEKKLGNMINDISVIQNSVTAIQDPLMQSELAAFAERYKHEHGFDACEAETAQLAGTIRAMEYVLAQTNAKKYNQFMCSICMEHLVDTFLEPCGHVFCESCLIRTRNPKCPTCRSQFVPRKIYTTM